MGEIRWPTLSFVIDRCSMNLRLIPSIRNIFIAAVEAGLGPANPVRNGAASKYPEKKRGKFERVQLVVGRW